MSRYIHGRILCDTGKRKGRGKSNLYRSLCRRQQAYHDTVKALFLRLACPLVSPATGTKPCENIGSKCATPCTRSGPSSVFHPFVRTFFSLFTPTALFTAHKIHGQFFNFLITGLNDNGTPVQQSSELPPGNTK